MFSESTENVVRKARGDPVGIRFILFRVIPMNMDMRAQISTRLRAARTTPFYRAATRVLYNAFYPPYQQTYHRFIGWRFDRKWGVETTEIFEHPKESLNPLHRCAVRYESTAPQLFREIMRSVGCLTAPFTFYDVGCGKGRVLLMASEYSFRRIVGIEFSPELATVAQNNVVAFNSKRPRPVDIEVVCLDAARYEFPDENSLIFLFNPFNDEILVQVLENIRASAHATKERYIIYSNPVLGGLFSNPEHFVHVVEMRRYSIYRMIC